MKKVILSLTLALVFTFTALTSITAVNASNLQNNVIDVYLRQSGNLGFDIDGAKEVSSTDKTCDFSFNYTGYFMPKNDSVIQDLGNIEFEVAVVPQYGYSTEKIRIEKNHVYCVKSPNGVYGKFQVMSVSNDAVELRLEIYNEKEVMPEESRNNSQVKTIYLGESGNLGFDLDNRQAVGSSDKTADFSFYYTGYFMPKNGAVIQDLGIVDFNKATIPQYGYLEERAYIQKDHVYIVKNPSGLYGKFKVLSYNKEVDSVEFNISICTKEDINNNSNENGNNSVYNDKNNNNGDNVTITLNGKPITMKIGPKLQDSVVMAELNEFVEILGAEYDYDKSYGDMLIAKDDNLLYMVVGEESAVLNKEIINIEAAPIISDAENKTIMIPAKSVAESLGIKVLWNESTKTLALELATELKLSNTPYWVENKSKLVVGGKIVYTDDKGIYCPLISPDHKYLAYSQGTNELILVDLKTNKPNKIYKDKDIKFRQYPIGWSSNSGRLMFISSHSSGFTGGNKLSIIDIKTKKTTLVTTGISGAAWGRDGKIVVSNASETKIIDEQGRIKQRLKLPAMGWFVDASNPTFTYDGLQVIYDASGDFYLHDLKNDKYTIIFTTKNDESAEGSGRIDKDGKIIVSDGGTIYIYDLKTNQYQMYYDKAKCSYPNWY